MQMFVLGVLLALILRVLWKFVDNYVSKAVAYVPRDLAYLRETRYAHGENSQKKVLTCLLKEKTLHLPGIYTPPSCDLSIVIPSYNEEERLPDTLKEIVEYVEKRQQDGETEEHKKSYLDGKKWTYESIFGFQIIVVDDGSRDQTVNVALRAAKATGANIRVVRMQENVGKGGAVRVGALCASGALILMADADGATPFTELDKLEKRMNQVADGDATHPAVVIGSRAHLQNDAVAKRSFMRNILMHGFHWMVHVLGVAGIRDTQCGFKLFTRRAAAELFAKMHVERWAFDVEVLYLAQQCKMSIEEVDVNWTEMPGSKLVPFWSWLEMGRDVVLIRYLYTVGHWRNELPL